MQTDDLTTHAPVWASMQQMLDKNRLAHALLFTGPPHADILQFVNKLIMRILCKCPDKTSCGKCQPCHLLIQGTHPDVQFVRQETLASPIKIDQIRELHGKVYQTPQCGERSIIVIESAERLNQSAANALLKILEEPPSHMMFILIAEQISNLPATIMSRCQKYAFSPPALSDYLTMGTFYPEASQRAELFRQCQPILQDLCDLFAQTLSPCTLAAKWANYALEDVLWFLYLLAAQTIRYQLSGGHTEQPWAEQLRCFASFVEPVVLFQLLDRINALRSTLQQNITLNQTLALEMLLIGLTRRSS
jgi:DNA polymerase-3 subunit delta'